MWKREKERREKKQVNKQTNKGIKAFGKTKYKDMGRKHSEREG